MNRSFPCTACVVLLCAVAAPARAESFASSASSAGSASLGSVSDSIGRSSNSSSGDNRTADGDYRVIDVAAWAQRPGTLQLTLRAVDIPEREFVLRLPVAALAPRGIAAGDVVRLRNREYGLEFARAAQQGATAEPFFLALNDDWRRELDPRAVTP
jgi:hypothetical protein